MVERLIGSFAKISRPHIKVNVITIRVRKVLPGARRAFNGYEVWVNVQNTGKSVAQDVRFCVRVPSGEHIYKIESDYFIVDRNTKNYIEFLGRLFQPGFQAPPVHFFASVEPSVSYSIEQRCN